MEMAERFSMPIITFMKHPGRTWHYERRAWSEAIARNLREDNTRLSITGHLHRDWRKAAPRRRRSGGGVGDKVNMLQYSTYSVISPERLLTLFLWKSADKKRHWLLKQWASSRRVEERAEVIDSIIPEPLGGAHHSGSDGGIHKSAAAGRFSRLEVC